MAFVLADRVRETSLTTGTGTLTLAGAQLGFKAFSAALATSDTTFYAIVLADQWETGIGTLTSATTLARTTVIESSNANALVNFGTGTKDVFISQPGSYIRPALDSEVISGANGYRPVTSFTLANEFIRRRATLSQVNAGAVTNRFITPAELAATTLPLVHLNVQDFLGTSGTWTKPDGVVLCLIEVVDGGDGGAWSNSNTVTVAGGNGGEYNWRIMLASDLPATVAANVGAAGNAGASGVAAGTGGRSFFGSSLAAAYLSTLNLGPTYRGLSASGAPGGNASKGGAAGGGSGQSGAQVGGTSTEAGNGGNGVRTSGTAGSGQLPGGGGGAATGTGGVVAGAGGAGRVKITSI